jgi:regulator of protease activity HflC (stomatin/prohibitin superfamily)
MALIPVEEPKKSGSILDEPETDVGIRWVDLGFTLAMIVLVVMLIVPPKEDLFIKEVGISINVRIILLLLILVLYMQRSVVKFDEYERGVVLRFGRFKEVYGPGWCFVFPIIEKAMKVDLRLNVYTVDPQEVVTRDKVRFLVSPEVFMYVSDPKAACLNVKDYRKAVLQYVNSALTHTCGNSPSDYIVSHMDEITHKLEESIHHISNLPGKEWGVTVPKIKITLVRFPDKVQDAMHEKVAAEQLKLAAHEKAEATKIEIDAIREAGAKLTDPAITYMYLEALDKVAQGRATKIVLPLEVSKIAETITRRTGAQLGEIPSIQIPPELVEKYTESIDGYEKRIKSIENRLSMGGGSDKNQLTEKIENYEKDLDTAPEKELSADEKEKYKQRIKEIKGRLGIKPK